jgi:hypothetical protein
MKNTPIFILLCIILSACQPQATIKSPTHQSSRTELIHKQASAFFNTYAERKDWNKLLSFYRADMKFQDIPLQLNLDSLWQFERFYNWPDTNFRKLTPEQPHLEVEHLVVNDSVAIAYGHFNSFYWYGKKNTPDWGMNFTMLLEFDEDLKIRKHIDWIEYDADVLESMINRYRMEGVDKPPSWLNLER